MGKIITWSTPKYSVSEKTHETDNLFYADDVIRYSKFRSPLSIKFCLADAIRYTVGNQSVVVPPGGSFVVNNGTEMECLPNKPGVRALIVSFTDDLVSDVNRNFCKEDKTLLDNPHPSPEPVCFFEHVYRHPDLLSRQLYLLAKQVTLSGESNPNLPPDIFYHLAEGLLTLQRDVRRQIGNVNARSAGTREELYRRVLYAKDWMQDHWYSQLQLEQIAHAACLSPYHFHRSFREAFGQSPMKWLCRLKLQKAREILEGGETSVTRVAYLCGFADVFSFSKAFKRELGINPSSVLGTSCSNPAEALKAERISA
ncbi:MAG: AraC family transcriptional regulator [Haliscomenobacteraceae bacterium CHB4]|nr:HTH-type transcriptional activator RhaS [Saprospiraceae bacterium]MCE7924778.1 AraC family transcriptional regulator [Haliscomenobacteraceae bacterium CHB4]